MKAKNLIKKIFILLLIWLFTWLFSSCNYSKKEIKTNTNTKIENVSKGSNNKKEDKKSFWNIKNTNISNYWGWSAQWWKKTKENPLGI